MLESTYKLYKTLMTLQSNISIWQLILTGIGTIATCLALVIGCYVTLKIDNAVLTERVSTMEKKVDKTDEKFDKIIDKISGLEVKLSKVEK